MKHILKTLFFLLLLAALCSIGYGQSPKKIPFATATPTYNTFAYTPNGLWVDSVVRFLKYSSDSTHFLYVNSSGNLAYGTVPTAGVSYTAGYGLILNALQFRVDTTAVSTKGHLNDTLNKYLIVDSARYYDSVNTANILNRQYTGVKITDTADYEGDSIWGGTGSSDSNHITPVFISNAINKIKVPYYYTGSGVQNAIYRRYYYLPAFNISHSYIFMIGMAELRENSTCTTPVTDKENKIAEAHKTLIANNFLDTAVAVSNAFVTKTGTWTTVTPTDSTLCSKSLIQSLGLPKKSSTAGDKLSYTMTGNNVEFSYFGVPTDSTQFGRFQVKIDGVIYDTVDTKGKSTTYSRGTAPLFTFNYRMPCVWFVGNLSNTAHLVELTLLDNKEVDFDYVGRLGNPNNVASVVDNHLLYLKQAAYVQSGVACGTLAQTINANTKIDNIAAPFISLGYPLRIALTERTFDTTTGYAGIGVHPNDYGAWLVAKANLGVIDAGQRILSSMYPTPLDTLKQDWGTILSNHKIKVDSTVVSTKANVTDAIQTAQASDMKYPDTLASWFVTRNYLAQNYVTAATLAAFNYVTATSLAAFRYRPLGLQNQLDSIGSSAVNGTIRLFTNNASMGVISVTQWQIGNTTNSGSTGLRVRIFSTDSTFLSVEKTSASVHKIGTAGDNSFNFYAGGSNTMNFWVNGIKYTTIGTNGALSNTVSVTAPKLFASAPTTLDGTDNVALYKTGTGEVGNSGVAFNTIPTMKTGSATLDFGSTVAGASTDLTVTVTGAADGDVVAIGVPNASTVANGCFTAWVSATNTVTIRFTNTNLVTALDPASGTFKVKVLQ